MGFGKDNKGVILREDNAVAVGALANDTAIKLTGLQVQDSFRMLKSEIIAHIVGLTAAEGEGLWLGICNSDLSVTEIAECLTADGPLQRGKREEEEKANRFVKLIGRFDIKDPSQTFGPCVGPEGGAPITIKPRWTFAESIGYDWFIWNQGIVLTTGSTVSLNATSYGVWVGA